MTDFLLELRSEEIPARMQGKAREDLARLFTAELATAGLAAERITTYATPRRLTLIAHSLPEQTEAASEELKGPRTAAPPQALDGFLRKTGLTQDQLVDRDGIYYAVIDKRGRATAEVLAQAIPAIIRAFPWPKSMRWGDASASTESLRWVRPLQGIVALFDGVVVPFEIAGIASGNVTVGHRFHSPGSIVLTGADAYIEQLRDAHVIVDQDERRSIIALGATMAARKAGLDLVQDEGLLIENAGLTEWPVPLLGRFDEAFLDVPPEVIQLTARVNQKYFVCRDSAGALANAFICTANIDASDGGAKIVEGNRKVLAARLSDAKFFYDTDLKVPLEDQAKKLEKIVFHEKLGTLADKVDRVAKLARWLVEEGIVKSSPSSLGEGDHAQHGGGARSEAEGAPTSPGSAGPSTTGSAGGPPPRAKLGEDLADLAERAARLAKADLVTGMVGEFPELQGMMGGYYARAQGEDPRVADAIRDHYKPVGQGDDVPTASVTVAVSLADKLDTIVSFFAIGEKPTGSKDPFALRRASLAIIRLIKANNLRLSLREAILEARRLLIESLATSSVIISQRSWDEGWAELPELRSPIQLEQVEELLAVSGVPNTLRLPGQGHDNWIIHPGAVRDHGIRISNISDLLSLVTSSIEYILDRLEELEKRDGSRIDLIRSVIPKEYVYFDLDPSLDGHAKAKRGPTIVRSRKGDPLGPDDLVRLLARVHALQAFITTDDGVNLLAGYKRAANILKKEGFIPLPAGEGGARSAEPSGRVRATEPAPNRSHPSGPAGLPSSPEGRGKGLSYIPEIAEAALIAALDSAEPRAAAAVAAEDFAGAMAALATLRAPIDAFFDSVTVNDTAPEKRTARLALLDRVRGAVHNVADFSRIEG